MERPSPTMLMMLTTMTDAGQNRLTAARIPSETKIVKAPHKMGRMADMRLRNATSKSSSVSGKTRNSAARVSSALMRRRSAATAASPVNRS